MKISKGNCGIKNYGNTCWLNTALQSFLKCNKMNSFIKNYSFKSKFVNEYKKVLEGIENENCIISPVSFIKSLAFHLDKHGYQLGILSQQDIHEFLVIFIDLLHEETKHPVNMTVSGKIVNKLDRMAFNVMKDWQKYFENNYSKFIDIFYGQLVSEIKVINSKEDIVSYSYSPVSTFSLPIPEKDEVNLYDCFDLFSEGEILEGDNQWKYDKDNKYYDVKKTLKVWKFPDILIIHLKRFDNSNNKITTFVDFPKKLDLEKYCIGYSKNKSKFNLISVCNQIGSIEYGHYFAYCKDFNNWYKYDDENITSIDSESIVTKNAYILFYKKY